MGAKVHIKPPVFFVSAGALALGLHFLAGPLPLLIPVWVRWPLGGLLVTLAGALLRATVAQFTRTGQKILPGNPAPALIAEGPYRYSRNPMYLSALLLFSGVAVAWSDLWFALAGLLALVAVHFAAVLPEEVYLRTRFGQAYLDYQSRVRRYL